MLRLSCAVAVAVLISACHPDAPALPEPVGSLEGVWLVGLTDPVKYDMQNNVLTTYTPALDVMGYTQLTFTSAEVEEYSTRTNKRTRIPYVRTGEELTCPPPANSYTIRKLTAHDLDLYYRGDYLLPMDPFRIDFTIHLHRP